MKKILLFILLYSLVIHVVHAQTIMRLHGSNTVGAQLGPELIKAWLFSQGYSRISRHTMKNEEIRINAKDRANREVSVEIFSHGSATGFTSLAKQITDIAMASRPVKPSELKQLNFLGDITRAATEHVIALDGIAVIVNHANPLTSLSREQIKKIFSGEIIYWQQLGKGYQGKINIYARDNRSGTYDTFKALVLGKNKQLVSQARRFESNSDLSDRVAKDKLAIGFTGLAYIRFSKAISISEAESQAKFPSAFDIATEEYSLARRLYMYTPYINEQPQVKSFIEFCLSNKGQKIVDNVGFISQNLIARKIDDNEQYPLEYRNLTRNNERLALNLRFKKGSTKLDNKAHRDIKRLLEFMQQEENKNKKIMLFGFAERTESKPVFALDLSTYRVDWVSDYLVRHGIDPVRVRAYGNAIPVASNEDAGGRNKNRRVEIWLKIPG